MYKITKRGHSKFEIGSLIIEYIEYIGYTIEVKIVYNVERIAN